MALRVDNERWQGVPFLMSAGKGLDERLAEVRVRFKKQSYNELIPGQPNELIIRIQPNEGIYLRCTNKHPGWNQDGVSPVQLDMSYKRAFPNSYVAAAYERVFLNAARGDQSLFVGSRELVEAWRLFTPLLDEIDQTKPQPVIYPFGSRSLPGLDEFAEKHNVTIEDYKIMQHVQRDEPQRSGNASVSQGKPNDVPFTPSKAASDAVIPGLKSVQFSKKPNKSSIRTQSTRSLSAVMPVLVAFVFGITFCPLIQGFIDGSGLSPLFS